MNRNSPVPLWAVLTIGVSLLGGIYLVSQSTISNPQASVTVRPPVAPPQTRQSASTSPRPESAASFSPSATSSSRANIRGSLTYRNDKYGFQFAYPASWDDVEFNEASWDDREAKRGSAMHKPDMGKIFIGNFIENKRCRFGSVTPDYGYGSEWPYRALSLRGPPQAPRKSDRLSFASLLLTANVSQYETIAPGAAWEVTCLGKKCRTGGSGLPALGGNKKCRAGGAGLTCLGRKNPGATRRSDFLRRAEARVRCRSFILSTCYSLRGHPGTAEI